MNLEPSSELLENVNTKFASAGMKNKANARIASAKIEIDEDFTLIAPVYVPDLDDLKAFAEGLHKAGEAWNGIAFGWYATYEPRGYRPIPEDSKQDVSPASFCLGDAIAWNYCLTWDYGDDQEPVESITSSLLEN